MPKPKKAAKRARKAGPAKVKGISRIDYPGSGTGWFARVTFEGKTHSRYFADASHGGTDKALDKAVRWRNVKEKELGKPRTDRHLAAGGGRSSTGVPGVYRAKNSFVVAWSPEPGNLVREFVSIREFGEEKALERAVALRRQREREVYGKSFAPTPKASALKKPRKAAAKAKKASARKTTKVRHK
jgi:hypothetical protein